MWCQYLLLVLVPSLVALLDGRSVLQSDLSAVVVYTEAELQAALLVIEPGQTVELDVEQLQLIDRLLVNVSDVELRGRGSPPVLRCPPEDHALVIQAPATIRNLQFRDCSNSSAVLVQSTDSANSANVSATFSQVGFHRNGASDRIRNGAGLHIGGCGNVPCTGPLVQALVEECDFTENRVNGAGAAIYCTSCNLTIRSSEFQDNTAEFSGGAVFLNGGFPALRITSSSFINNRVLSVQGKLELQQANGLPLESLRYFSFNFPRGSGGAIATDNAVSVVIDESLFRRNRAPAGGALSTIFQEQSSNSREDNSFEAEISDCTFEENRAYIRGQNEDGDSEDNLGGAIYLLSSATDLDWTLRNSALVNNRAMHGGGVHMATLRSVKPQIRNCTFRENQAVGAGGGLLARNTGAVQLEATTFFTNTAGFGGGVMLTNSAMLNGIGLSGIDWNNRQGVPNQFIGNSAVDGGGLMCSACGDLNLNDAAFIGNSAERLGGGVYCVDTHVQVNLLQIALEGNNASQGGGAAFSAAANVAISAANFDGFHSSISSNTAASGGGVYIKSNRQQENKIQIQSTLFSNNIATQTKRSEPVSNECGNGGGVCLVLDSIPEASTTEIRIINVNFTDNEAGVGGGMFVEVTGEKWNSGLSRGSCPDPTPSTDSCRLLAFTRLRFSRNRAKSGGGAMFISNPEHVIAGCSSANLDELVPLDMVFASEQDLCLDFQNNTVINGAGEYGPQIATRVYSLQVVSPLEPIRGLTGGTPILPPCEDCGDEDREGVLIAIKDAFNQTIAGGIADSRFHVSLISEYILGENIYQAQDGLFNINRTNGVGIDATHVVEVQLNENRSISTNFSFSTRKCHPGEIETGNTCERCEPGTYSFDPEVSCRDCPDHAQCSGNSALVPIDGYWHSSPFSTQFHQCIVKEACIYTGREDHLEAYYRNTTQVSDHLADLNGDSGPRSFENYEQCEEGYQGVLCGTCKEGYGHLAGGECVKCAESRGTSALIVVVLVLWVILVIVVNMALTFVSTKRQIAIADRGQGNRSAIQTTSVQNESAGDPSLNDPEPINAGPSQGRTANRVKHIIALEKISETLKILINYLQVTSTALSIDVAWLASMRLFLSIQTLLASVMNGSSLVPLDCSYDQNVEEGTPRSIQSLWLRISLPFMLLAFLLVAISLYFHLFRRTPLTCEGSSILRLCGCGSQQDSSHKTYSIVAALVVFFFCYSDVTSEFMRSVNCIEVDKSYEVGEEYRNYRLATGRRFWAEDTNLRCFKGDHIATAIFGMLGMAFFSVGSVAFLSCYVLKNQDQIDKRRFIARFGYIYGSYDTGRKIALIWEMVVFLRKALIAAVVVFAFPLGANLQAISALGVLILALALHLLVQPFEEEDSRKAPNVPMFVPGHPARPNGPGFWAQINNEISFNWIESASLVSSIVVFYSGILFNDSNASEAGKYTMATFALIVNLTFFIYLVYRIYAAMVVAVDLHLDSYGAPNRKDIGSSNPIVVVKKLCDIRELMKERGPTNGPRQDSNGL